VKSAGSFSDQESAVYVCARLRAAGIPFKVSQSKRQFGWGLEEHYQVFVPPEFHENAKKIAEQGCVDFPENQEGQEIIELQSPNPEKVEHHSIKGSWPEEDATVEVWSEKTKERPWFEQKEGIAWMIELSLRENGIRTRIEMQQDGSRRIFVSPDDELRAHEIVREIAKGIPPA